MKGKAFAGENKESKADTSSRSTADEADAAGRKVEVAGPPTEGEVFKDVDKCTCNLCVYDREHAIESFPKVLLASVLSNKAHRQQGILAALQVRSAITG